MPVIAPGQQAPVGGDHDWQQVIALPPEREDFYREAFAHSAVGLAVTDLDGRFLQVNPAYCAITGYPEDELLATDFATITHPDDRAGNVCLFRQLLAGVISHFDVEKRYLKKNGAEVWTLNSIKDSRHIASPCARESRRANAPRASVIACWSRSARHGPRPRRPSASLKRLARRCAPARSSIVPSPT
jgi:PAS domain S-box-containing protein